MRTLVQLWYSPWSEKARWSLDHHKIPYKVREHLPMVGEPLLRAQTGKWTGRVSVPVLLDMGQVFPESVAIAQHADRIGTGSKLFSNRDETLHWSDVSEKILRGARASLLARLLNDDEALMEALPPFIPDAAKRASIPVAVMATRFVEKKWVDANEIERLSRDVEAGLDELRAAIKGGKTHLLGELSYADIAMATSLQMISPVTSRAIPLGPATRRAWTSPELAAKYPDLLDWRDSIYEKSRFESLSSRLVVGLERLRDLLQLVLVLGPRRSIAFA
ncbi:MAG: glutathione S-transferase N-terminal domain-containing protein [Polyangiaceae bacterium]